MVSNNLKNGKYLNKNNVLLFTEEEHRLCDWCHEKAKCASIILPTNVTVVCKSCLDTVSFELYSDSEKRDIIIDKILKD
jgi:hypothetical protein